LLLTTQTDAQWLQALRQARSDERIDVQLEGPVLWLTVDREAQHNALALAMLEAIASVLDSAAMALRSTPDRLRLVVITGRGERSFAAGGDLKELDAMRSAAQTQAMTERGMAALNAIRDFPQPVLAGLNGSARGGGAELAMACDWRSAHDEVKLGFIQGQLGLSPAWGGGTDLLARLGRGPTLRLLAEAALLDAREAQQLGLIEVLTEGPAAAFAAALRSYVAGIAQRPAQVLRAHKALANRAASSTRSILQAEESAQLVQTWTHDDHWALAANALKRS
jgi:enoyl-CoA hydratase